MKKLLIVLALLLTTSALVKAQTKTSKINKDSIYTTETKKTVNDTSRPKGNDRSVWSGYLSGFLNMVGTDGKSSLQLSSSFFTLTHLKKLAHNDTLYYGKEYRDQWFARNLQLNFGLTPDSKNQVQIDALTYGVKYAIMNNKTITKNNRKNINTDFIQYLAGKSIIANSIVEKYRVAKPTEFQQITDYKNAKGALPISSLPQDFVAELKKQFNLKDDKSVDTLLIPDLYLVSLVKQTLKNKPTLTFSANSNYDELKSQTDNINVSGEFAFYSSKQGNTQYDLKASYSHAADTTKKNSSLVRTIWDITFGSDFTFTKVKWFELKPGLEYTNTQGPLYKKEYVQAGNITVTPRFKINQNFWLPITFKYNAFQKDAHFQGLFSVQYSLK